MHTHTHTHTHNDTHTLTHTHIHIQETIELLLAQASIKRTGRVLNLVVWIVGVCPPPEAIEKVTKRRGRAEVRKS